jgi:hypothetical protein
MNRTEIIDLFDGCEYPEHVEEQLGPILEAANEGANLSADEWQTVFESLATDVEFREARWLDGE